MKRTSLLAFAGLMVFSTMPSFAWTLQLAQFYAGIARPREDVAWIWLDDGVHVTEVDHTPLPLACAFGFSVAELLPGRHEIWVRYWNTSYTSPKDIRLDVDATSGQNYVVHANARLKVFKPSDWNPVVTGFTPTEKAGRKIERCH